MLGIFSLVETISLKIWQGPLSQRAKCPLSVSVRGLQDVENHCVHLTDIELTTARKIVYLRFTIYFSLYIWIGEHEITKLKKYICFESRKKRTQKQAQKDMNEME